jgi:hypothetical protein
VSGRRKGYLDAPRPNKGGLRLDFNDGVSIDTAGPYRIIREKDGLYVTGHGFLCAVDTKEGGQRLINSMRCAPGGLRAQCLDCHPACP